MRAFSGSRKVSTGVLVAGEGQSAGQVANWSRRPRLMHIPKSLARPGALVEIEVQRLLSSSLCCLRTAPNHSFSTAILRVSTGPLSLLH